MKCFKYAGQGQYSHTHGWDNGLNINISPAPVELEKEPFMASEAIRYQDSKCRGTLLCVYANDYGGTRTEDGYIIAESHGEAMDIAQRYVNSTFRVREYESNY